MDERAYHDRHYKAEAARLQDTAIFGRVHARTVRRFLGATGIGRAHRVLSLGCGDGAIELRLAPYVGEIVGVDISPVAVERARARFEASRIRNGHFHVVDGGHTDFNVLGKFDAVAAVAFLHHLGDAEIVRTLAAARTVLCGGGVFYSTDPSRRRLVRLFAGFVRPTYQRYHSPDERELNPDEVAALAVEAGFSRPVIGYVDYFLGPLAWLAPGMPDWMIPALTAVDELMLGVPIVRRRASSFSLTARASEACT